MAASGLGELRSLVCGRFLEGNLVSPVRQMAFGAEPSRRVESGIRSTVERSIVICLCRQLFARRPTQNTRHAFT